MSVRSVTHNEPWKVVTNTGATVDTLPNAREALTKARLANRHGRGPVAAVRA